MHVRLLRTIFDEVLTTIVREVPGATVSERLLCARANEIAYLKFPVCGRSTQASKHTSIHTHACNEVTLVWGSLRLAPITVVL